MKKTLLLIALAILSFVQISAQVVTIGTGTEDDDGLPIDPYYKYSYSQCLYLASEINQTGNIYRIKYKAKARVSISNSNDWTIYMGHTADTTLVSNSWIPTSAMTQVFTGTVAIVNDNVEVTLTTPFNYNGTDNLVIAIDENKNGFDSSTDDFLSTNVTGQRSLLYRNDNTNPDPANMSSLNSIGQSAIANIDLDFNATACNAPTALSVTNITINSADISWTAGGTETSWQMEYGTAGFTPGTGTTINSASHTLSGLNQGTIYQYYVKANCSAGATSSWVGPFTFSTICVPYSIPYFEGFESNYTHEADIGICFSQESVSGTPKWQADDNTTNSSNLHAPRTGDWNALLHSGNKDWLFIPVQLTGGTSYTMELYARYSTSATPVSKISMSYGTSANSSSMTNTIVSATTITNAGYQKLDGNFTPTTSGTYYVGIYGQALSLSFGYMTLDDISIIETPSCVKPSALSSNAITANSANLNWTAGGSGGTSWQIEYDTTGFAQGTGTTLVTSNIPHALSGLSPETTYDWYIREICRPGDTSMWTTAQTFTTACAAVTSFPFIEKFETITTGRPNCWGIAGTTTNASFHWKSFGRGETGRGIRFNSYNNPTGKTSELTTPTLDLSSLPTAQLSFYFKNPTGGNFEVLISTDGGTNYTSLENNLTGQTSWLEKTYNITSHIGSNVKIQFKGTSNYGTGDAYVYLDGVEVKEVPSCIKPTSLTTNNITATSIDLGWTAGSSSSTSWQIEYSTTGFTQGTGTTAITSSNPHSLSGLTPETTYDWYVREICGTGDTSVWSSINTFTTACAAITDFNENFDGTPNNTLPNCWSKIIDNGASSSALVTVSTFSQAHSGNKHIRMYNAISPATANMILVSPLLSNLNAGTHWLRFYARNTYATENLQVGTMSNPADASTFTPLQTVDINDTYTEYTVNFSSYSGTDQYIAIRRASTVNYTQVYLDDIIWEATPSCLAPTNLTTSNSTIDSIDLGWTAGGSGGASWQIEYGATGFTQGAGTTITTSSNPHSLSGLTANTRYDWYIREICGAGDTSTWTSVNTFTTACGVVTDFNEGFEGATTPNLPNCWGAILDNGTSTRAQIQTASSNSPASGTKHIKLYNSTSPDTSNIILVSPQVSNLAAGTHRLRLYAKNPGNSGQNIEVGTITNPTDGNTFTSVERLDINDTYTQYIVNFNTYSGTDQYIAIRRLSTRDYSYVWLDDIVWEVIPSCAAPTSLTTNNITATSIDLGWTAGSSSSTSWQIEYDTTGFTQGTGTMAITSSNPHSLSGLTANTSYDWYVREICGAGDTSAWTSVNTFTTACGVIADFNENFDGTPTNTLPNCWNKIVDNGSGAKVEVSTFGTAHSGNKHIRMYNATSSATANIVLVSPLLSNLNAGTHWLRFYARNTYATEDIQVGTISNPADASTFTPLQAIDINSTYAEYSVSFNNYSGTDQYIAIRRVSTVSYTNVYLDNIIWEVAPTCLAPATNLTTNNIAATSVDLGWTTGGSGGTSWQIEYGATGFTQGTGTIITTSNNPHTLSGLTANTNYDWYVREICSAGDTSTWTGANTFTTACSAVTDFNENFENASTPNLPNCWGAILDNGTASAAQIQTATSSNPVSGTKHVKLYNSTSPDTSNIILVSPQVSNLSAGTHQLRFYAKNVANVTQDIEVGTVTNPTDGSTFTSLQSVDINNTYTEYTVNFSTYSGTDQYIAIRRLSTHDYSYVWLDDIVWEVIPTCPQPGTSSLNASNITTTSADLSWTAGGAETIWSIEYGVAGFTQGTGTTIATSTTNPYSLTGLTGTTSYDFYVRGICGAGDTSTWAGPFTFSTACATVTTFPFVEEFEGITTGQPNCWGISGTTTNTNYDWFSHSNGSQGRGIRFNSFSNASGNTSELTTPLIDLSSLSAAELKFNYKNPTGGNFEVLISTDGGATYNSLANNLTGQTNWLEKTYNITSYIGSNVKIQFKGTSNFANGDAYIYLDGVEVRTTSTCTPVTGTDVQTACGAFTWIDGNVYTSSNNTATHTIVGGASNSCDSVVTLNLTITPLTLVYDTIVVSECSNYTWAQNSMTYNTTGMYNDTIQSVAGCDSAIKVLDLTINMPTTGTDTQTACGTFTWIDGNVYTSSNNTATHTIVGGASNSCDSVVTLNLTINQPSAKTIDYAGCQGDGYSIVVGSTTYNEANPTGTETLTNVVNCDSVVTINLTFNSVDNGVQVNNNTITANESNADTYAWINCDNNNTIIAGETSASYTPTETGNYAVIITKNNCVDTSVCSNVIITSINDVTTDGLKIYPNPTTGIITIETKSNSNANLKVLSYNGKEVYREALTLSKEKVDLGELPKGLYFIVIEMKENTIMQKITIK